MKSRTTIVLGLICLGLLLYVYLGVWKNPGTTELQKNSKEILSFRGEEVVRVELKNTNGIFTFSKKNNQWMIEKPISSPANNAPIGMLLSELDFGRRMETIANQSNPDMDAMLDKYGLKEPRMRLDLKTATFSESIMIGKPTAVAGAVYALLQTDKGREIVALDQQIENYMSKSLDEWRSRDVLSLNPAALTGLVLRNKGQDSEVKKEGATWKISKPVVAGADEAQIRQFLADLIRFRIVRFVSEDNSALGTAGLNTPSMVLEISEGEKVVSLSLGLPDMENPNAVYAMVTGRSGVFTLPKDTTQLMGEFLNRVRDRRISKLDEPSDVSALSITFHGAVVDLVRDSKQSSSNWKIKGRNESIDSQKVDFILRALSRSKVVSFSVAGDPENLLKNPLGSIKIFKKNSGDGTEKLFEEHIFATKSKDEVVLKTPTQPSLVTIPSTIFDNIPQSFIGWFSLNVFGLKPTEIDALTWKDGDSSYGVARVDDHSWKSYDSKNTLDWETLDLQLKVLSELSAVRWLGPLGKKELAAKPLMVLQIKRGEATDTLTFIHELKDQTVSVRLNDQECAFAISPRDYQVLKFRPFKASEMPAKQSVQQ